MNLCHLLSCSKILVIIILITLFIRYLIEKGSSIIYKVISKIAFITGLYTSYTAVDHFSIVPWIFNFGPNGNNFEKRLQIKKNLFLLVDSEEDKNI